MEVGPEDQEAKYVIVSLRNDRMYTSTTWLRKEDLDGDNTTKRHAKEEGKNLRGSIPRQRATGS